MEQIRIGLVGMGNRGLNWIDSFRRVKGSKVVAICDKYAALLDRATAYAEDADIQTYEDYDEMLAKARLDAVGVVVEPLNQADLICKALAAGKHVACEVPLSYSIEDCWKVVLAAERSGRKFMMAEQIRYAAWAQAWKKLVSEGTLGKIIFCEGQYFHGMGRDRFYQDGRTGRRLTIEEAKDNPHAVKSRFWSKAHSIFYLPHELSPLLNILDDRVVKVVAMGTRPESYHYEGLPFADIEVALMHTAKDTILRLATCFQVPTLMVEPAGYHWYHVMGTKGRVETNRSKKDGMKLWLPEQHMADTAVVDWDYRRNEIPHEAFGSGHHNADYFPMAKFIKCIREDARSPMDAYKAADATVPALIAGASIDHGSRPLDVPDFRPGAERKPGESPKKNGGSAGHEL